MAQVISWLVGEKARGCRADRYIKCSWGARATTDPPGAISVNPNTACPTAQARENGGRRPAAVVLVMGLLLLMLVFGIYPQPFIEVIQAAGLAPH